MLFKGRKFQGIYIYTRRCHSMGKGIQLQHKLQMCLLWGIFQSRTKKKRENSIETREKRKGERLTKIVRLVSHYCTQASNANNVSLSTTQLVWTLDCIGQYNPYEEVVL